MARVLPEKDGIAGTLALDRFTRRIFRKTRKNRNPFVAFQRHPAGREAPPLLALRRITDHHLEALRAGKTGTAGALTGPAAGSYHTVAHGSFCPLLRCGHFGARRVGAFQNCN